MDLAISHCKAMRCMLTARARSWMKPESWCHWTFCVLCNVYFKCPQVLSIEIFSLTVNRKVYQPNTIQVTEQLFAQVRCFQHSQLSSPLLHCLKKSWGSPRFHSNLSDYNSTCPKKSLYFPFSKHFIAFWLGNILEQCGNSYSSLGSTRGPKYSQAKCLVLGAVPPEHDGSWQYISR